MKSLLKDGFGRGMLVIAGFILVLACLMAATSCSPVKRMGGIAARHPDAALTVCNRMFPPTIDTVTSTEYIKGQTVTRFDTVTVDCDSVMKAYHVPGSGNKINTKYVRVPCPPSTLQVDTLIKTITITLFDKKKVMELEKELTESNSRGDQLKDGRDSWRTKAIWAWGIIALIVAAGIVKLIMKLKSIG